MTTNNNNNNNQSDAINKIIYNKPHKFGDNQGVKSIVDIALDEIDTVDSKNKDSTQINLTNNQANQDIKKQIKQIGVGNIIISDSEKKYLQQVIDTSRISYGPLSKRFEQDFAKLHDSNFGVFCNSGTSALHIALAALKEVHSWENGDEVIVPALTFIATSNIIIHNNMKPVFVDIEQDTYNIDPKTPKVKFSAKFFVSQVTDAQGFKLYI